MRRYEHPYADSVAERIIRRAEWLAQVDATEARNTITTKGRRVLPTIQETD